MLQMAIFLSFYGWVVSHYVYVPHLVYPFICLWTHILAIVNNSAMNIGYIYLLELVFLGFFQIYILKSRIAGLCDSSAFSCWDKFMLFSTVTALVYIPTNSVWVFLFPHPCQHLFFFWRSSFWQVWDDVSLWFWIAFPQWLMMLSVFLYACCTSTFPLWKHVSLVLLSIFGLPLWLSS